MGIKINRVKRMIGITRLGMINGDDKGKTPRFLQ